MGVRRLREAIVQKKSLTASERDHCDIARRRAQWIKAQGSVDPSCPMFIQGPKGPRHRWCGASPKRGAKTNTAAPRDWAWCGQPSPDCSARRRTPTRRPAASSPSCAMTASRHRGCSTGQLTANTSGSASAIYSHRRGSRVTSSSISQRQPAAPSAPPKSRCCSWRNTCRPQTYGNGLRPLPQHHLSTRMRQVLRQGRS